MMRLFADTSYFIALGSPSDAAHIRARSFANQPMRLVVSSWVMTELAAFFSSPANRGRFSALLASLRSNPDVEFINASQEQFDRGTELYAERHDKAWSLVDCISFVLMRQLKISDALTTDHHFVQGGFKALLLN